MPRESEKRDRVRIREPQYTQGCEKIECAQEKVNYYKEIVLRGMAKLTKKGFSDENPYPDDGRNEAAYRDAAIF
ncbi:hypothetical protein ACNKHK_04905 [Shigella flexneri]